MLNIIPKKTYLTRFVLGSILIAASLLIASIIIGEKYNLNEHHNFEKLCQLNIIGQNMLKATDHLTNEARSFVVTKDIRHYNNYWKEINITKTSDSILSQIKPLDITPYESSLLAEAKTNTPALSSIELRAMRLVFEGLKISLEEIPDDIKDIKLSAEDLSLSNSQMLEKSKELMFDSSYNDAKNLVINPLNSFIASMSQKTKSEIEVSQKRIALFKNLQISFAIFIIISILLLVYIFFTQYIRPIELFRKDIENVDFENDKLLISAKGSQEIRLLAKAFQELFLTLNREFKNRTEAEIQLKNTKDNLESLVTQLSGEIERRVKLEEASNIQQDKIVEQISMEKALTKLNSILYSNNDSDIVLENALNNITEFVGAHCSTIFLKDSNQLFSRKASYAFAPYADTMNSFSEGETIPGQAVKERRPIITTSSENNITISFGTTQSNTAQLIDIPLLYNDIVLGVIEFGLLEPLSEIKIEWLYKACERLSTFLKLNEESREVNKLVSEISEKETLLRQLLESSGDGLFGLDSLGKVTFINPMACKILGYSPEEVTGHTLDDGLLRYCLSPTVRNQLYSSYALGRIVTADDEILELQGKDAIAIDIIGTPMLENGNLIGAVVSFRDITDKKQAENELKKSKAFIESVLNNLNTSVYSKDVNGNYTYVNLEWQKLTGKEKSNVIGTTLPLAFDNATVDPYHDDFYYMEKNTITVFEEIVKWENGDKKAFITTKVPLYEDKKVVGLCSVSTEITQRKLMEDELFAAKERAEDASRAKEEFLANMSHEIRTPLNAILGMAYLVSKTDLSDLQKDYLSKIETSSHHLLGIINDILDFSKVESGKLVIENIEFHLESVLSNVSAQISEKAAKKNLEIIFDVDKNVPSTLVGDPLRIGQILINFINNAVKFTDKGEISLIVKIQEDFPQNLLLYFAVKDTGIGLSEKQMENLFESFSQADSSITRKYGGTGLGLAISKRLAHLMDGEIGVESVYGQGSTFWFTALLRKSTALEELAYQSKDFIGKRVLVVDDNENIRLITRQYLNAMGFKVDLASSGPTAVTMVIDAISSGIPYEIVFMDWQMADMDGITAGRQIKEQAKDKSPHLIMITAYGMEDLLEEAKHAGFEAILIKPIQASVLFDAVIKVLSNTPENSNSKIQFNGKEDYIDKEALNVRILVVEDNDLNQLVAKEIIEGFGYKVDIADNGNIAINKLADNDYDIVMMDMHMPVMDGITATRAIRKNSRLDSLPIIAMTANAMEADRKKCLAAGMNDYITKPLDVAQLFELLNKWLYNKAPSTPPKALSSSSLRMENILANIGQLDYALALNRMGGNQSLYYNLVKGFCEEQADFIPKLTEAIENADYPSIRILSHTIKGLLGSIGATTLQDISSEIEKYAKEQKDLDKITDLIQLHKDSYQELIIKLKAAINDIDIDKEISSSTNAPKHTSDLLTKLYDLLQDDNPDATLLFKENELQFKKLLNEKYDILKKQITRFDYEAALSTFNSINLENN